MPGRFRCAGATGQAPTTSFFGYVPDRFNAMYPFHLAGGANAGGIRDGVQSANNVNQWTIFNTGFPTGVAGTNSVSLGGMITAPDGNNTAQHITEATTNSIHGLSAGINFVFNGFFLPFGGPTLRLSVFAKAAERTRIVLQVGGAGGTSITNGCQAVYDLAAGTVAVANTQIGTGPPPWLPGPATIKAWPNGWYQCEIDVTVGLNLGTGSGIVAFLYVDAGSGNAAANITYTGDGASGVYVWRSCMLPPAAWAIPGVSFFDDFLDNTMAEFDLTNSKAPGFTWYLNGTWPATGYNAINPVLPSKLSVSGSVLTFVGHSNNDDYLFSACTDGANGFVGSNVFQPPMVAEVSATYSWTPLSTYANAAFWTAPLESLTNPTTLGDSPRRCEFDFNEPNSPASTAGDHGIIAQGFGGGITAVGAFSGPALFGYPLWISGVGYFDSDIVSYLGNIYQSTLSGVNTALPTNVSFWTPFTPSYLQNYTPYVYDSTQMQTYSNIWCPWQGVNNQGTVCSFFNGIPNGIYTYGPNQSSSGGTAQGPWSIGDGCHWPLIASVSNNATMKIDWIKVTGGNAFVAGKLASNGTGP